MARDKRCSIGAYWLCMPTPRFEKMHGVSLWKIVDKQSKGWRKLEKVEMLKEYYIGANNRNGIIKTFTCNQLDSSARWIYVKDPATVRALYGK